MNYEIEELEHTMGTCDCCRNTSHSLSGFVHTEHETIACYFFHLTEGKFTADHPANIDIIIGQWGEGCTAKDRQAVSLIYFENENGPAIMIIDAKDRDIANSELIHNALNRDEIIDSPLAKSIFSIFDAIIVQDTRL